VPFVTDLRTVLGGRDFRRLFAVRLTSQAADGAFQTALASLLFFSPERAATATGAAGALAVTVLPYTLVGPFAGVLLDRWQRRQVLVVANTARAVVVLAVAGLLAWTSVGPALYGSVLICLSINRFFLTALGASLPHVVPGRQLVMANAVSPTSGTLAALTGGGLAYLLRLGLPAGDPGDAMLLTGACATYLAAAALATRMPRGLLGPDLGPGPDLKAATSPPAAVGWRAVADGAGHLATRRPAVDALAAVAISRCGYGVTTIATVLLCRNHFNDPADVQAGLALLAQVFAASAIGYAAAALLTPPATDRWGTSGWTWRCLLLGAGAQLLLLIDLTVPVALVAALLLGCSVQGLKICTDATLQRLVDDDFRGRVFATYDMVFNLAFVLAAAAAAVAVPADGDSPAVFATTASLYLITAVALIARSRSAGRRPVSRRPPAARPTTARGPAEPPPR
jgi:MFS family permease